MSTKALQLDVEAVYAAYLERHGRDPMALRSTWTTDETDVLKVIDQGADDTTNAVSIRKFFAKTAGVATTTRTREATIIQTRHRIPEEQLTEEQILVYQVPIPEPLRFLEPRELEAYAQLMRRGVTEDLLDRYGREDMEEVFLDIARGRRQAATAG